jgi:hypothetical protein
MLEIIDIGLEDTIAFRVTGNVSQLDVKRVIDELDRKQAFYEKVNLYEEIQSSNRVEMAEIKHKISQLITHAMPKIRKIAIMTDTSWLTRTTKLENKIFKKIDIRAFAVAERKHAIEFLQIAG